MILTIDAGNTNTVLAVYDGDLQVFESRINTDSARMADQYAIIFSDIMGLYNLNPKVITGAIMASVVPPVTRQVALAVERLTGVTPLNVEPGLKTGLNIKLDDLAAMVGADLVCGAVAAKSLYPCPCVAIDMGTVNKVLALDKEGSLIGGVISPGVGNGFESMSGTTALLPLVGAGEVKNVIGSNTIDCIRSGIILGTAYMLDGFIEKFEEEIGRSSIVATGGFSELIIPYCKPKNKSRIIMNKSLVSQGLMIIYNKNTAS
jgi:type III pantothenate kinase